MKPRPPISISVRITICPKPLHWVQVSKSVRPVTQVAEVAVNSAPRKEQPIPLLDAAGVISSSVPIRMIDAKARAMSLVVLIRVSFRLIHRFSFSRKSRIQTPPWDIDSLLSTIIPVGADFASPNQRHAIGLMACLRLSMNR